MEIVPGILEKSWQEIAKKLELAKMFAKSVHVDIIDGKFIKNLTFLDPAPFKKYSENLFLELHMMVNEPLNYLETFARGGFKRFLGQVEKMSSQIDFIAKARKFGEAGLALDNPTPLAKIQVPLDQLDVILLYTGKSLGWSGGHFQDEKLGKIREISSKSKVTIEVDGGINGKNIRLAKEAGATRFVSAGFIFKAKNPELQYQELLAKIA